MKTRSESENLVPLKAIENILSSVNVEALKKFVCDYANRQLEFNAALRLQFDPVCDIVGGSADYGGRIEACFISSHRSRSHNRYSGYEGEALYEIAKQLDQYLEFAESLLAQKSFDEVASIAIHTLRGIAEHYEEDEYYSMYDECFDLSSECEMAGDLLLQLAKNPEVPQPLKDNALNELCDIAKLDAYSNYGLYGIDQLVKDFSLSSQTKEGALKLIDKMLSEASVSSYMTSDLVMRKIDLLNELGRNEESKETIEKYIAEPRIRKIKIDNLLGKQNQKAAIQCIDEGICLAREMNHRGTVSEWMNNKLDIYKQANDTPQMIIVARELFMGGRGQMEYYHLLKKCVPGENWKSFLEKLMKETALSSLYFLNSSAAANIYVAEKDEKRLMNLLKSVSSGEQLNMLLEYAHHLKQNYSAELLDIYAKRLEEYAGRNMGRNHYEYVAKVLTKMQELQDGKKAVSELVTVFRSIYKRRPAMMELIKKF